MSLNRLPDYLDHMRQAVADAQSFTDGMAQADFLQDKRTQNAVVMSLIVLGEAATKVMDQYPAFVEQHKHIPWRSMRGMRNRIAHGYFALEAHSVIGLKQPSSGVFNPNMGIPTNPLVSSALADALLHKVRQRALSAHQTAAATPTR